MPAIQVEHLSKTYRVARKSPGLLASVRDLLHRRYVEVRAVVDLSFTIPAGEMVGFLGPNGAGKTTALKMLSGLVYPTAGECRVLGYAPARRDNGYRRQFALVMGQKNQLWWDLPASESFELNRRIYDVTEVQYRYTVGELVDLLGVGGLIHQPVRELSLGERMKMELIAALLHSPRVLFLDEPTIGLDVVAQARIRDCLRQYNQAKGVTVLITSHYMRDIEALCKRVIVINRGRLVYDGALSGILDQFTRHKLMRVRFHSGEVPAEIMNAGRVVEVDGPEVTVEVERGEVAGVTRRLLARFAIDDIAIEDPPIEETMARAFE